ncbi:helix-turn-helix transcriptional regulator [bacterium]|nr:helix-turn-helix transcriptional regulator [bacterium]
MYISRVERGVVSPSITVYQNIAKGLGVSLSNLFFIPSALNQIDPEQQMKIIKIVDTLIDAEKSKGIRITDALLSFLEQIDLQ